MHARPTLVLLIATALGVASTCLPVPQAAAASLDACAMLTPAEVGAALGVAVDAGERLTPTETRFCTWHEQGKKQARNVRIDFITERQYEIGKTPGPNMVKSAEGGIGDDAYFSKAKGMVFNLSVKKGATYFRVMVRSNSQAFVKANDAVIDEKDKDSARYSKNFSDRRCLVRGLWLPA
jgi:hypothetical protein